MTTRHYILVSLLASFLVGCSTHNVRDFPPLFDYRAEGETESLDIAGPFYSHRHSHNRSEWAFRPFISKYEDKDKGICEYQFLYPLGKYRRTKERRYIQFIPFVKSGEYLAERRKKAKASEFFPVFWGTTEDGEKYGGFFPFYGTFKNRFGRDRMTFFLWPLYSSSREDDTTTYKFMWPFFSYTTGKNRKGFRIWPLYGYDKKDGVYLKRFVLWPFFIHQKTHLDTDNPKDFFAIFPLYVSIKSKSERSRTALFPLFTFYERDRDNFRQRTYPWPILTYAKGDGYESRNVLPLYSWQKKEGYKSFYVLSPIYKHEVEWDKNSNTVTDYLFLINKYERKTFKEENGKAKILRFWPLFYYRVKKEGDVRFDFPHIIPIENEGFDRNYGPLFHIYQYRKDANGNEQSKFLWGLYTYRKRGLSESRNLSFIASYKKDMEFKKFSLLKGLFEYQSKEGTNSLRFLYLPWRIRWQKRTESARVCEDF